jgi:hypothetical protein
VKVLIKISGLLLFFSIGCTRVSDGKGAFLASSPGSPEMESDDLLQGQTASSSTLVPVDYVSWMRNPENGIRKEKQIEEIIYSVQYKTPDYIACIEADNKDSISPAKVTDDGTETIHYFDFKMTLENYEGEFLKHKLNSPAQYDSRVKYLAFGIEKDISLVEGGDTIPCTICHFERAYDVAPEATLLLGFVSKKKYLKKKEFIFHDKLFGKGIVKFTFTKDEMKSIPKLRTFN